MLMLPLFIKFFQLLNPVARRLQEHECRMLARGFPVQPVVGAGDSSTKKIKNI